MTARILENIITVFQSYEVFLVDAWGVLHDGKSLYPGAGEMLEQLTDAGKKIIILSNAARRIPAFKEELAKLDILTASYTDAVTSGDLTWQAFNDSGLAELGTHYFYQGPQRSRGILDGLALTEVRKLREAQFIINAGVEGNQPDTSAFAALLREARKLTLPMVCANPDRVAIRGGVPGISAGAIALAYEQLGGKLIYFGKPHAPIYQYCFDLFPEVNPSAYVMLGDGLATDIKGANKAGIDSVFLTSGIHQPELSGDQAITLSALFEKYQAWPEYVVQNLSRT
jgi:HAD superfamily hydrolase (TIGR01459 family)